MPPRSAAWSVPAFVLAAAWASSTQAGVDEEWLRTWREAQRDRPEVLAWQGRIAPTEEPGVPLVIEGWVVEPDGETPAPDVVVFAYQTDRNGLYSDPRRPDPPWRLRGWARTGDDGRFELRSVRPGAYPDGSEPAHVHLTLESPGRGAQWTPPVLFADDPLVGSEERRRSAAAGRFGLVCEVGAAGGVARVSVVLRLKAVADFEP